MPPLPRKRAGKPTRSRKKRKAPKQNPLNAQVNSAILSQSKPYLSQIKAANTQYGQEEATANNIEAGLQGELAGIGNNLAANSGSLLAQAAQRNTGDGQSFQRNTDFLKSVLGDSVGDFGGAVQPGLDIAQRQSQVSNVGNTTGLAYGAQASQRDLASMRGAAAMRKGEDLKLRGLDRTQRVRGLQDKVAELRAQAPLLRRQFQQENLENSILSQRAGLEGKQAAWGRDQQLWERGFENQKLAQDQSQFNAELNAETQAAGLGGLVEQQKLTDKQRKSWGDIARKVRGELWVQDKDGKVLPPAKPFTTAFQEMTARGLPADEAAQWAFQFTKSNKPTWVQKDGGVKDALRMQKYLRGLGVSDRVSRSILKKVYGNLGTQTGFASLYGK